VIRAIATIALLLTSGVIVSTTRIGSVDHHVVVIGVLHPNNEIRVVVNGDEIDDSPVWCDSTGVFSFIYSAECPCLVEMTVISPGPAALCEEHER